MVLAMNLTLGDLPAASVAQVEVDVKAEVVAPAAVMAQLMALGVALEEVLGAALEEVLVVAPEACQEATAVGSNRNLVSRPFYCKQREVC